MNLKFFSLTLLLLAIVITAQTTEFKPHVSNFNMMSFTYKHNDKWQAYVELQMRSIDDYMLPNYYEAKGGIGYNFIKNNQIFVGAGRYGTYRDSEIYQNEFRMWLQYVLSQKIEFIKIDHRFRAEKRFFTFPQTNTESNDERYRYRLSLTVPLNDKNISTGTIYFNTFEEVFVGPKNPDWFKRNRFYSGFGYQVSDFMNTNIGYMWQKEFSSLNGDKNFHFVYFAVNFTLDREKNYDYQPIPVID